ncbi:MAG: MFS transporter [Acidobacteria bacterium]|nr:MFS transporter [Acidobacteriota bacterium]
MPASRVRHRVVLLTFLTSFIMYMDRVAMGSAAPAIMADFHLSKIAMGWSTSAFNWAYALFQAPGGWMADRYGPRLVLAGAMAWWSAFTAATGLASNAVTLAVARFLFGMGEAAAFPASARALVRWLPARRRAFGQGFQHAGSRFGAAVTPPLVAFLVAALSWRWAFYIFGAGGIFWAVGWYLYYRDDPRDHRGVSPGELEVLPARHSPPGVPANAPAVPWGRILRSRDLWFLSAMYFCYGWVLWMYLFWLPTYLVEARHFTRLRMGFAAGAPLLAATFANMAGGWLSDRLAHGLNDLRRGRLIVSVLGFAVAGIGLVPGVLAEDAVTGLLCLTLALAGLELTVAVSWAICLDIGGDSSGSVSAVMNTLGNIGGALSAVVIGYLATRLGWNWPFLVASAMCLIAAALATRIDPTRSAVV